MPPLKERFIKYLKFHSRMEGPVTVNKQTLWNLAIEHGYTTDTIKTAFRELDDVVYIGNWWDSKKRMVEYIYYDMTPEEIRKKEEDREWFDSL